jgi:hypothetical protein
MATKSRRPFVVEIQPDVLSRSESHRFMRLYAKYVERSGAPPRTPPRTPTPTPTPKGGTLSNCRDTDTECTCDHDD